MSGKKRKFIQLELFNSGVLALTNKVKLERISDSITAKRIARCPAEIRNIILDYYEELYWNREREKIKQEEPHMKRWSALLYDLHIVLIPLKTALNHYRKDPALSKMWILHITQTKGPKHPHSHYWTLAPRGHFDSSYVLASTLNVSCL